MAASIKYIPSSSVCTRISTAVVRQDIYGGQLPPASTVQSHSSYGTQDTWPVGNLRRSSRRPEAASLAAPAGLTPVLHDAGSYSVIDTDGKEQDLQGHQGTASPQEPGSLQLLVVVVDL
mmetsp:Transcript_19114/g.53284  ORF Transcript_19114/g.53284 Transcript_19114/m.53284 type:complete len:119 (-) Transcript_19114:1705-2061(-)